MVNFNFFLICPAVLPERSAWAVGDGWPVPVCAERSAWAVGDGWPVPVCAAASVCAAA